MPLSDDFRTGSSRSDLWSSVLNGTVTDVFAGRSQALMFRGDGQRQVTSVELDTTVYKALEFDLIYGNGINGGDYVEAGDEVVLEYSTDRGGSWQQLQQYTFPGSWTQYRVNLPLAARSTSSLLRWRQLRHQGGSLDTWAIDNISFSEMVYAPPTRADFSGGPNGGLWRDMANAEVSNAFAGRSQALMFRGDGQRQVTSVELDTTVYKALEFDLIYGNGINGGDYVEAGDEVVLEYSTDRGGSWQQLQQYTFPGSWTQYRVNLPLAARSTSSLLRWRQLRHQGGSLDTWAIDNISFSETVYAPPTRADFSGGPNGGLWRDMANAEVSNAFAGRSQALMFRGDGQRQVTSVELDTTVYKALEFDLIYGNGINGGDYVEAGDEVVLEYSTDRGGSWQQLQQYTFPGSWTQYRVNLPLAARSTSSLLRWRQLRHQGGSLDTWAIDNISFSEMVYAPPTRADFSGGPNGGLWRDMANAEVSNAFAGRSQALMFRGDGQRQVTSVELDTTVYKALEFDLIYGNGINGGDYVEAGDEVVLEYSTDRGGSWQQLQQYTFPGSWTQYRVNLPLAARSTSSLLRWRQLRHQGGSLDTWAIDNISFSETVYAPPTRADFSGGPNGGLWRDMANAEVSNAFAGRSQALMFRGDGQRQVTSVELDTTVYKALEFDLIYGNGINGGDYVEAGDEVVLEYSTDQGKSWNEVKRFANAGRWSTVRVELSKTAQSRDTILRWRQLRHQGGGLDTWAMDNIRLFAPGDKTPPAITDLIVQNDALLVNFSEPIVTTGLTKDRFTVRVGSATRKIRTIGSGARPSQLRLTLAGAPPSPAETVRLAYADPKGNDSKGVVQDEAGNDLASVRSPGRVADTFHASATVNRLVSTYSRLQLIGAAAIGATGHDGDNIIRGNEAANLIDGLAGNDVLTGRTGADTFRFSTSPNASSNRDQITDFSGDEGDRIALSRAAFPALPPAGILPDAAFQVGAAIDPTQRVLYDPTTGALTYDPDGSGPSGGTVFATLPAGLALGASQVLIL